MAATQNMPDITFDTATLIRWGNIWKGTVGSSKKDGTPTRQSPQMIRERHISAAFTGNTILKSRLTARNIQRKSV